MRIQNSFLGSLIFSDGYSSDLRQFHSMCMLWLKLSKTLGQELLITRISLYYALIFWYPVLWSLALGLPRLSTPSLQNRMLVSSPSSAVVWKYKAVSQIAELLTLSFSDNWLIFNAIKLTFFKYFRFFSLFFFGGEENLLLWFIVLLGFFFFETGSQYVVQSGLELSMLAQTDLKSPDIHLPPPPGSWDNEYVIPCQGLWLIFWGGVLFKQGHKIVLIATFWLKIEVLNNLHF